MKLEVPLPAALRGEHLADAEDDPTTDETRITAAASSTKEGADRAFNLKSPKPMPSLPVMSLKP